MLVPEVRLIVRASRVVTAKEAAIQSSQQAGVAKHRRMQTAPY
jgi:hypothetical protein